MTTTTNEFGSRRQTRPESAERVGDLFRADFRESVGELPTAFESDVVVVVDVVVVEESSSIVLRDVR